MTPAPFSWEVVITLEAATSVRPTDRVPERCSCCYECMPVEKNRRGGSKPLLKPVVGIRLGVERLHFLVALRAVERPSLGQSLVGLQA